MKDSNGEKVAFNQFGTFVQRAGGFGGKRDSDVAIKPVDPPTRAPDASMQEVVHIDQVRSSYLYKKLVAPAIILLTEPAKMIY